ncbi:hypothetical protein I6N95_07885 [Vagococcus sp. BWB3-3]|uniref:Uncharacterized protein n=1 Tax=Vagococcus allomyrinae TaxID=2794353 RepID=A0A940P717_9ENTE|nr:hypothetical protein [Vagococcus allomyrinae]MBP1040921.1 hypothetical protein [Vagococcus allomyrinae]
MTVITHDTDNFFSFHDAPIVNCYFKTPYLCFEFEYVYCWLNNNNTPAIYSSEGCPKLIISIDNITSWIDWESGLDYTDEFESHLPNLIGTEFLSFERQHNLGEITLVGEICEFTFESYQIIVEPSNLHFYRNFSKADLSVKFH